MNESPRLRLHRLIADFRAGAMEADVFCPQFEHTYNMELDKQTLTATEARAFSELFEKVIWYSPFPEEQVRMPHDLGKEDIVRAVERATQCLDENRGSGS